MECEDDRAKGFTLMDHNLGGFHFYKPTLYIFNVIFSQVRVGAYLVTHNNVNHATR